MNLAIWGHRGSHGPVGALENTLEAFENAVAQGADGIELDVHASRDGRIVVFHDETLARLSEAEDPRAISDLEWMELREHILSGGCSMPLLETVLEQFHGRIPLNIEIKDGSILEPVLRLLNGRSWESILLSSFSWDAIARCSQRAPAMTTAWISGDTPKTASASLVEGWPFLGLRTCGADRWHTSLSQISPLNVALSKAIGCSVYVWTVNDPKDAAMLESMGVDGIFTDQPGAMRTALSTLNTGS